MPPSRSRYGSVRGSFGPSGATNKRRAPDERARRRPAFGGEIGALPRPAGTRYRGSPVRRGHRSRAQRAAEQAKHDDETPAQMKTPFPHAVLPPSPRAQYTRFAIRTGSPARIIAHIPAWETCALERRLSLISLKSRNKDVTISTWVRRLSSNSTRLRRVVHLCRNSIVAIREGAAKMSQRYRSTGDDGHITACIAHQETRR